MSTEIQQHRIELGEIIGTIPECIVGHLLKEDGSSSVGQSGLRNNNNLLTVLLPVESRSRNRRDKYIDHRQK